MRKTVGIIGVLIGCATLVLALPGSATAADELAAAVVLTVEDYDTIEVTWTTTATGTDAGDRDAAQYEVGYLATTAAAFGAATPKTMRVRSSRRSLVLDGLDADTDYLVCVRARYAAATVDETNPHQAWGVPAATCATGTTEVAVAPAQLRTRDITVTPGDMELRVEWEEPDLGSDDLPISEYEVAFGEKEDGTDQRIWPFTLRSTLAIIDRLENGTTYYIWVRSKNASSEWSEYNSEPAMGTPSADADAGDGDADEEEDPDEEEDAMEEAPALPIFATIALGSLLAGRGWWLRRKQ